MKRLLFILVLILPALGSARTDFPRKLDLRNINGKSYVTSVKHQDGGTCWTFGTMASIESNLMMNGNWVTGGESGEAALAEYHLDWWNGFNEHYNADIAPDTGGLTVHQGGDYKVSAAYVSRGDGAVRLSDGQSFDDPPERNSPSYHVFYARDIEWLGGGKDLEPVPGIKQALMESGAVATGIDWSSDYYDNNSFYQSPDSSGEPNHSVTIVGWDDDRSTGASQPGAWLAKNSWGTDWGNGGFFWISYYDKHSGHHPEMGAVAFKNVERMRYQHVYYLDYHGWRDTKTGPTEAFNSFTAEGATRGTEDLSAVSFYTTVPKVQYNVKVYTKFENGQLDGEISQKEGVEEKAGFHTVDLNWPVPVAKGDKFYLYLKVSDGGLAFDRTSNVPVVMGANYRTTVESKAMSGVSFYRAEQGWVDASKDEKTAKFCIKALSVYE